MTSSWMEAAACSGVPLEWFDRSGSAEDRSRGLALCAQCPVRVECLRAASPRDLYWTIRGGQHPLKMQPLLRKAQVGDCGTVEGYRAHLRSGEAVCGECLEAQRAVWRAEAEERRARRERSKSGRPVVHGTAGGYERHLRNEEVPCDSCRDARRIYDRERYQRRLVALVAAGEGSS